MAKILSLYFRHLNIVAWFLKIRLTTWVGRGLRHYETPTYIYAMYWETAPQMEVKQLIMKSQIVLKLKLMRYIERKRISS